MSWNLVDGEIRHAENPDTFWIPEKWERYSLEVGDFAKLIFETDGEGGERMWVQITESKDGNYVGSLNNTPFFVDDIDFGDVVAFTAANVIDVMFEG